MSFYDSIRLEKGMYGVEGKNFTSILESIDPSENYKGTELEGLDAYQRQLKRFNIRVSGIGCDTVEKFFSTVDSSVLFPEFLSRAIKLGLASAGIDEIVAARTFTNSIDHRGISATSTTSPNPNMGEGNSPRDFNLKSSSDITSLLKHGRLFTASYETIRSQNLDVIAMYLRQVGKAIAVEQMVDVANALLTTTNTAHGTTTLTYGDVINMAIAIMPYKMNILMANASVINELLNLTEVKGATTEGGANFQGSGILAPFGAKLICVPSMLNKRLLAFDKSCTLQMVQSGDLIIDYDKVIEKQLERTLISIRSGFFLMNKDSCVLNNYS